MIVYSYKNYLIKLLIIYFICLGDVYAQNNGLDASPPQNIVPDIFEEVEKIIQTFDENNNTKINDEVTISELPDIDSGWIGILSNQDEGLGWNMWVGTDSAFAKIL